MLAFLFKALLVSRADRILNLQPTAVNSGLAETFPNECLLHGTSVGTVEHGTRFQH